MLYIVPTPIGNLEDITLRALRVLKEVDLILAEDTRVTRKLLSHYNISQAIKSFHIHNEHKETGKIIEKMKDGMKVALVSDAGMPGISDPGFLIIRETLALGLEMTVLPGPSAVAPALLLSGFPSDEFTFLGFLPQKKGRKKKLLSLEGRTETLIFYESPHRIKKLAIELAEYFPEREVALVREISKIHEEVWRGSTHDMAAYIEGRQPKGEMVVVLSAFKK